MKQITFAILTAFVILVTVLASGCTLSADPFGAPPKGASPNCGPEERYKFNVTIDSKEDFVNFIKNNEINKWVRLDNFKGSDGNVDWNNVSESVKTQKTMSRTIYSIDYTPSVCSPAQKFTLKMSNDGQVSIYGCCGK